MQTGNPNMYLRDGTSFVNLLRSLCSLYSLVLLLPNSLLIFIDNSHPDIERCERLMAKLEFAIMTTSSYTTYLRADAGLVNSLC